MGLHVKHYIPKEYPYPTGFSKRYTESSCGIFIYKNELKNHARRRKKLVTCKSCIKSKIFKKG